MERFMIVGLGNPGKEYRRTRHNIGFICVDTLAGKYGIDINTKKFNAVMGDGMIKEKRVLLVKPQTYMNNSGVSVRGLADFFKIPLENILVIYDDIDIDPGMLRIRPKGGTGGHNGMRSLIHHLGAGDFPRIRFGVGRPPGKMEPARYVLMEFLKDKIPLIEETIERVIKAIELWLTEGIDMAMNRQNGTAEQAALAAAPPPEPESPPDNVQSSPESE